MQAAPAAPQHPLSVSSSGESDGSDDETQVFQGKGNEQGGSGKKEDGAKREDKEAVVKKVVELLDNEEEEEVKRLLSSKLGDLGKVSSSSSQDIRCGRC